MNLQLKSREVESAGRYFDQTDSGSSSTIPRTGSLNHYHWIVFDDITFEQIFNI